MCWQMCDLLRCCAIGVIYGVSSVVVWYCLIFTAYNHNKTKQNKSVPICCGYIVHFTMGYTLLWTYAFHLTWLEPVQTVNTSLDSVFNVTNWKSRQAPPSPTYVYIRLRTQREARGLSVATVVLFSTCSDITICNHIAQKFINYVDIVMSS